MVDLSADQFLPGMGKMREAKPYQQTPGQFMNRTDVHVHGRYVAPWSTATSERDVTTRDFHAGTRRAAHQRLADGLGLPWETKHPTTGEYGNSVPKFFYGRVNPTTMENTPERSDWEAGSFGVHPRALQAQRNQYDGSQRGRMPDQMSSWTNADHNRYYRNDVEDKGSTSVILSGTSGKKSSTVVNRPFTPIYPGNEYHPHLLPKNFVTWRGGVTKALAKGKAVPHHIQGLYNDTGGAEGFHSVHDTEFDAPKIRDGVPYSKSETEIPGFPLPTGRLGNAPF